MLDHEWYTWFAKVVAVGEFMIGLGLIAGALVGIAAFSGTLLNVSFMLAGTTSSNPVLFALTVFLVLAWKVAGYWGLDRYLIPLLGSPWTPGTDQPAPTTGRGRSSRPSVSRGALRPFRRLRRLPEATGRSAGDTGPGLRRVLANASATVCAASRTAVFFLKVLPMLPSGALNRITPRPLIRRESVGASTVR